MKKKFSESAVTQEVVCEPAEDGAYEVLKWTCGEGYEQSLKRRYMRGLREYLKGAGKEQENRLLFLTPDRVVARQSFLICLKEYAAKAEENGGDDYDYDSFEFLRWEKEPEQEPEMEDIMLVTEQEAQQEGDMGSLSVEFMGFSLKGKSREQEKSSKLQSAENVLIELGTVMEPENIVRKVLRFQNANTAVWIRPSGGYEYLVKRLVFEGGYRVIKLEAMEKGDYLDCAQAFLEHHHFAAKKADLADMLDKLMAFRGENMCEEDVYLHLSRCMSLAQESDLRYLEREDLALRYDCDTDEASVEWDRVIGLDAVKEELVRHVLAGRAMAGKRAMLHNHMILEGPPGTGKSKMARLYAKMLAKKGLANGKFVDAVKADVVGRYVGQTAFLVRDLFRRAEGGVLFLDEASFLLKEDQFVQEAVVELVRYMELFPETTVIFATYPKEGKKLLNCDPGFQSRISKVLVFPEYSGQELWEILQSMAEDYGFVVDESGKSELEHYIGRIRHRKNYGNAREVRKLLETAIQEFGLRMEESCAGKLPHILSGQDMSRAAEYLIRQAGEDIDGYGFAAG